MQMMARVEGMPLGVARGRAGRGTGSSFGEWLDRIDGRLAVNAGFLVGHSTMRRVVMGDDATHDAATPEQIEAMVGSLHESLPAGALGVLVVARRGAHRRRRRAGAVARRAARRVPRARRARCATTRAPALEFIPAMGEISDDRIELMTDMSLAADRPLNWNLLGSASPTPVSTSSSSRRPTTPPSTGAHGRRAGAARRDAPPQQPHAPGHARMGRGGRAPRRRTPRARSPIPRCASALRAGLDAARTPGRRRR